MTGEPVAGSTIDRNDKSDFYELNEMTSAPEQWWSVKVKGDLSAYPSYTTSVHGNPLIYLTNIKGGPGQIVLLNAFTGQRKWTATLDDPTSCTPIVDGRYLPCRGFGDNDRKLRYLDLTSGALTKTLFAESKIIEVRAVDDRGTEFVVAVEGPRPGDVTVYRGTPTSIDARWTRTYRITDSRPSLYIDQDRQLGTVGFGTAPSDSATFELATGKQVANPDGTYDPNLWTWSDETKIRVDPDRRTFEILDAGGRVVGRGSDAGDNTGVARIVGEEYKSVVLIGDSAYDSSNGDRLWSDDRLMRPDADPMSPIATAVIAIVNSVVVLQITDDFPKGSLVGIDLESGRQLWEINYQDAPTQKFVDGTRWISILDGELQAFDIASGDHVWDVQYPDDADKRTAGGYIDTSLDKMDGRHLVVTAKQTVTMFGPV